MEGKELKMDQNKKEITKSTNTIVHIHIGPVYPCNYCSMCFINMLFLKKHKTKCVYTKLFTILKEKLQIKKKIKDESIAYNFQILKQEGVTPFVCEICQKDCHNKTCLYRHYRTHKDHIYACEFCDKQFNRHFTYIKHKRLHLKDEQIACNFCGKSFTNLSSYKDHIASHSHTRKQLTYCEYCFKPFEKGDDMSEHLATHTGKSPYECLKCKSTFNDQILLIKHLATHKGLMPFECGFCKKKFSRIFFYNNHIRIHTGETPFKCILCDKAFTQYSHLKHHTSEVHNKKKGDNWYNILTLQKNSSPLLYKSIATSFLYKKGR